MTRKRIVLVAISAAALILVLVFHAQIWGWFSGGKTGGGSRSAGVTTTAGDLSIDAAIEPDPPRQGQNALIISLAKGGEPVGDARIEVEVWMPAMGSMPEMRTGAEVSETSPGTYWASFGLSMGGSFTATIKASAGGDEVTADYGLTVGTSGLRAIGSSSAGNTAAAAVAHTFSDPGRVALLAALDAYEVVRAALAADSVAPIASASGLIAAGLRKAEATEAGAADPIKAHLAGGAKAADALAKSSNAAGARPRFSELSAHLVALIAADPALAEGRHAFECPMWEDGFNRWIQPNDKLENPYMGQAMPTCGSESTWDPPATGTAERQHDPGDIAHYTCPMHPWVEKDNPDEICPVCSMDLTPVTREEITEGIIRIDRERRQAFGVTTAPAVERRMVVPIHAVGRVAYDERRLADVTLKYKGWIEKLYVEETGERIRRGQPLFEVYSPALFAAQHELILAVAETKSAQTETQRARAAALLQGARKRMRLWDLGDAQIDAIIAGGKPRERLTVRSPASGYVIEKDVVEGAAVEPGTRLFRIANLDTVWVEAEIYEEQIPLVKIGQGATVRLSHTGAKSTDGVISFIYPFLDSKTRTARVRVEMANTSRDLKPDMFAEVDIQIDRGKALAVPEAAIIYSGPRRIVFVDVGQDRLRPTLVEIGVKSGGWVEIKGGVAAGDKVVISGNFLVAAESRLKSATGIW
jgi:Cu(I)/Ag(I) efflux system membrane fusion protein